MKKKLSIKSFELVLRGHPDKICDLVSNEICKANAGGRNAIECMWGNHLFIVSGETDKTWTDKKLEKFVKDILSFDVGLTYDELSNITVLNNLNIQSNEINSIVGDSGAGDNGIFFGGYHKVYSPVIRNMKKLCAHLTAEVLSDWGYRTDGKFIFDVDSKGNIVKLVMNCASFKDSKPDDVAFTTFIRIFTGSQTKISINPKGDWNNCFAFADCGLTGRKLACDGTCGLFSHGGGAMFGKDLSKADVTVPLFLNLLAEQAVGRRKVCSLSASCIIGDIMIHVYRDGKYFKSFEYEYMKSVVGSRDLDIFGALK